MIAIVNYGLGNVCAIANIYRRSNIAVCIASTPEELRAATKIILPGVGAFDWAMRRLDASGMRAALDEEVLGRQKPVLGICVGMQMMANRSEEGVLDGLGWIAGEVKRFDSQERGETLQLPHMGWNDVQPREDGGLFDKLGSGARFYFLHSYCFAPRSQNHVLAVAEYGGRYACSVRAGNVHGVQFHPEKSHHWGIQLLKNFAEL